VSFMTFTVSARNILDTPSYINHSVQLYTLSLRGQGKLIGRFGKHAIEISTLNRRRNKFLIKLCVRNSHLLSLRNEKTCDVKKQLNIFMVCMTTLE
jgi:hypothetical protein